MIDFENLRRGWSLLDKPEKQAACWVLFLGLLAAIASALMVGSVFPFLTVIARPEAITENGFLSWAYERFNFSSAYDFAVALGGVSLVIIVIANAIMVLDSYCFERFSALRTHSLSQRLLGRYLEQPYEFFLTVHSDMMSTKVLTEVEHLVELFYRPAARLWSSTLSSIAIGVLLIQVNARVAILAFVIIGGAYIATFLLSRLLFKRLGEQRAESNEERFRITKEALGGIKGIKVLGRERVYLDRFDDPSRAVARSTALARHVSILPRFAIQAITFGGVIIVLLLLIDSSWFDSDNKSLGDLVPLMGVFAFAGQRLIPTMQMLFTSTTELQYSKAFIDRVYDEFARLNDTHSLPLELAPKMGLQSELQLSDVTYSYPNAERPGLSGIDLTITAGESIGIVGTTGAGKTTLVDLILCLLRPQSGSIKVDGTVLTDDNLRNWQSSIGYVPQDIFLADASIAENIALGVPKSRIDMERVKKSAAIARLDKFVNTELDRGYDSEIGERGVRLSGGQRQRIGLARALYHDTDLFVFDEATSALDNKTEKEVMAALQALSGQKTLLIVAHRLSTIKFCDRIIVMDKGRIDAIDSFQALSRKNEILRTLLSAGEDTQDHTEK